MSADTSVSDLTREELEERVEALEALIEVRGVENPADADVSDIWIAGFPVGKILNNVESIAKSNRATIEDLEAADTSVSNSGEQAVRDKLLPLHKMALDVREGDASHLSANERRAARLFLRFVRKACGEPDTRVSRGYGAYTLPSDRAKAILNSEDQLPAGGASKTIKRVYDRAQSLTKREDCDCDSLDVCGHGLLLSQKKDGQRRLAVKINAIEEYLRTVEAAIDGLDAPATDDAVSPELGPAEDGGVDEENVRDELDALADASVKEREVADTVVSNHSNGASAAGDTPSED